MKQLLFTALVVAVLLPAGAQAADGNAIRVRQVATQNQTAQNQNQDQVAPKADDQDKPASEAAPVKSRVSEQGLVDPSGLDDTVLPLEPVQPRSATTQMKIEAAAWFAAGRVLESRNDFHAAFNAYKKAVDRDPTALAAYRALIPLAFSLNLTDEAVRYALRAVELDPSDYQLLRKLGVHQVSVGDLPSAIKLMEQALKAPDLKKDAAIYVTLMRDLALLYKATNRHEEAADCYAVVFDALTNHDKYQLDFKTRATLLADASATFERMGQAFLDVKRSQLAVQAFQKAAETKRGNAGNLSFNLAQVYLQSGETQKALEELQKYFDAQRQSKGRAAYELLAQILEKLGKRDELLTRLEALAEKDARNSTLQYYLADQYLEAKKLEAAEELYKKTLASTSELQGYVGLASVYRQQNRPNELIETLGKAFAESGELDGLSTEIKAIAGDEKLTQSLLEAGSKLLHEEPPKLDFSSGFVLAHLATEVKKTDTVQELFRYLLTVRKERSSAIYEKWGRYLQDQKLYAEAVKVYQDAVNDQGLAEVRPNFLYQLSRTLAFAGDTKAALETIGTARQALPDHPLLQYHEAWVYYYSHQYEEAIKRFEKVIATFAQPQFNQELYKEVVRSSRFSLSNSYVLQGDIAKGQAILEDVLKMSPDDPSVNNDLGYLYADQGQQLERAEQMIKKALASDPENGAYLDSMGWVLFKQGKYAEALPHLEKAVKAAAGSGDETIWDHLGDAYSHLQQPAKALEAWKKALESAKASSRPDAKLIGRIEEKIKNQQGGSGNLKPARPNSP